MGLSRCGDVSFLQVEPKRVECFVMNLAEDIDAFADEARPSTPIPIPAGAAGPPSVDLSGYSRHRNLARGTFRDHAADPDAALINQAVLDAPTDPLRRFE